MKMEDHFKETLSRAVANEPPVQDAWATFEGRVRRGRRARLLASIAAAAAVVAAGAIVTPKLLPDKGIHVTTPPPVPSPTDPYEGWETGRRMEAQFDVRYPKGWSGVDPSQPAFEGVDEIQPSDVEPLEKGLPTFAVTIRFDQSAEPDRPLPGEPTAERRQITWNDGQTAYRSERVGDNGEREIVYQIAWVGCAAGEDICREVDGTLVVRVLASTGQLWSIYGETGDLIARSVRQGHTALIP
jgi:hypothetical protein